MDDDRDVRELPDRELKASGFRTNSAGGGAAALERIAAERPAAVLLDLLMPDMDGFQLLHRIRDEPALRDLPVIVMTGKDLTSPEYDRLNGSVQKILGKGADMALLVRDTLSKVAQQGTSLG